jgi:SNF2 family DNA or RNA helicase
MLRPAFLGTLHEFGMRYCDGRPAQFAMRATAGGYDFSGASNLPELHQLLEAGLMIRRYKKDVRGAAALCAMQGAGGGKRAGHAL